MKKIVAVIATALTFALTMATAPAQAGPLTLGVWSNVPAPNQNGDPFFDNASNDGPGCDLGSLATTTSCGGLNLSNVEYLHNGTGGATAFGFENTTGNFQYTYEITALSSQNVIGWRDLNSSATGVIFDGSQTAGATVTVSLPSQFAFTYNSPPFGPYDSNGSGYDQFALLRYALGGPGEYRYLLGMEDVLRSGAYNGQGSDKDYNDAVISFKEAQPVPEPTTLFMLGAGLIGVARLRRRRENADTVN